MCGIWSLAAVIGHRKSAAGVLDFVYTTSLYSLFSLFSLKGKGKTSLGEKGKETRGDLTFSPRSDLT